MTNLGPKPDLKWLKLTQLFIPSEYQRPAKTANSLKNIAYIKEHFNWASCGALIVCPLAGSSPPQYAVIDGQHRMVAADLRGDITEMPCVVISQREARKQAESFVTINSKRLKLHSLHEYRAAVVAGDPNALSLANVLEKAGVSLLTNACPKSAIPPRCTQSIGTLYKMLDSYTEKQIVWALTIIPDAYGDKRGMMRASLIKAMAEWIKLYPGTVRDTMIRTLRDIDLDQLEKDARAYRAIERKSMPAAFMLVLEKKHNAKAKAVSQGEALAPRHRGA